MAGERKCPQCGAQLKRLRERFCGFCGTEVPASDGTVVVHTGPHGDVAARFRALLDHPDLERLERHTPSTSAPMCSYVFMMVFGVIFGGIAMIVVGGFAVAGSVVADGLGAGLASLFPLLFVAVGAGIFVWGLVKMLRYSQATLYRVPGLIRDERLQVSGGGQNSSASTSYYALLQFDDGERHEYSVSSKVAGRISAGDIGMAYVKAGHLLDFRRVDV